MNPLKVYDYLTQSRERVFDSVRALSPEEYGRAFSIGLKTFGSTLTHVMIVEWAYMERIRGHELPPYEQWPIQDEKPPAFDVIERTWRDQAVQTRSGIEQVTEWERDFEYTSTRPGESGKKVIVTASPADVFAQLVMHEVHHRAQVMAMLRELGRPLENIDYSYMVWRRRDA